MTDKLPTKPTEQSPFEPATGGIQVREQALGVPEISLLPNRQRVGQNECLMTCRRGEAEE